MELTLTYVMSQVFTIIMYLLLVISYYAKERKNILILGFLSLIANAIAYVLLEAYTGLAMCIVAVIRNIIFIIDENKNGKSDTINKKDITLLILLYSLIIISTVFTYDGYLSLLSVFATMIYTYSVWQKKTIIYKLLVIPVGVLWILYNIYVKSIFGVILESILLIASITGYIAELRGKKNIEKIQQ